MNVWQLLAAFVAVTIPIVCLARLTQTRRPTILILMAQVALIPEVAFAWYALAPSGTPSVQLLGPAVALFYGGAIAAVIWRAVEGSRLRQPVITLDTLDRQHVAALVTRWVIIVMISGVALGFVPWLGILNLIANAAWTAIWIPRSSRSTEVRFHYEISVAPAVVFEFVSDTANWPRYREDFVSARPPGRLTVGTEVVTRHRVVWYTRRTENLAKFVEVRSTVTSLVRDRLIELSVVGRPYQTASSELAPARGGAAVTTVSRGALTFPQAAVGYRFELAKILATSRDDLERSASRLKQILETPPDR